MTQYVKKPIPVTAIQWTDEGVIHPAIKKFTTAWDTVEVRYYVSTIENQKLWLTPGCWIVGPGVRGEYWSVQDDVFKETYEII